MGKGISIIGGGAMSGDGTEVPVYRALRDLLCSSCSATIGEGTLFTRRAVATGKLRVAAQCRNCMPFTSRSGERKGSPRSALLESLFTPEPAGDRATDSCHAENADAVRKRLGPALQYRAGKKRTRRLANCDQSQQATHAEARQVR